MSQYEDMERTLYETAGLCLKFADPGGAGSRKVRRSRRETSQLLHLEEVLRRSTAAPLTLIINVGPRSNPQALDLISRHAERWESVDIVTQFKHLPILQQVKGRLGLLKKLSLVVLNVTELVDVSLRAMYHIEMKFPYDQFTRYKDATCIPSRVSSVLTLSHSLTTLSLLSLASPPQFPAATFPFLKTLQVVFTYCPTGPHALNGLTIPAIESIQMAALSGNTVASLITIISNGPTPSPLKRLAFRSEIMRPEELTTLLKLTPSLLHLDASLPHEVDVFALANGSNGVPVAPQLLTCKFYFNSPFRDRLDAIERLVDARCELLEADGAFILPGELRRLKSLSLYFEDHGAGWTQQTYFHGLHPSRISKQLEQLRRELALGSAYLDAALIQRINSIMSQVEEPEVDWGDPSNVQAQVLYLTLHNISRWPLTTLGGKFYAKEATNTLKRWDEVFNRALVEPRWVFEGTYILKYLPRDESEIPSPSESLSPSDELMPVRWPQNLNNWTWCP
ncbi:hypothetical protein NLJ89_g7265 [Agrocybe chaxingu]|uniref:Uncharacterized protein n=1 Tax=Agrocybe chaxingu TaxID=84603 RepID=A0A9W8MVL6_9AGAR|nr:hypothetical protein NLJ89_g7265 [Agrocybe chaxingu]